MIKKFSYIFIVVMFFCSHLFGRLKLKKHETTNDVFKRELKVGRVDFRSTLLAFDVWYLSLADGKNKLLQIQKDLNGKWSGRLYGFYYYSNILYDFKNAIVDTIVFKEDWDIKWDKIENNLLIDISDQSNINEQFKRMLQDKQILLLSDGNTLEYDLFKRNYKKEILYKNPSFYNDYFKTKGLQSESYEHFLAIIKLLQTELELNLGF